MRELAIGGSGCLVRAAHTGLSWGITLVLLLYPTELQKQEERGEFLQPLLFVLSVFCSVLLYFVVSLMDPGYVESDSGGKEAAVPEKQKALALHQDPPVRLRRCGYCMVKQPMRAKHCQACRHCVRRYDHHCPWVENCIGERNHPLFIIYLAVQLTVLLWALPVAWSGLRFEQISWAWLQHNLLLLMAFLMILVFTLIVVLLLLSHLYLISCNTTTWEFISRHRISYLRQSKVENPFDQGVLLNLWKFFCACHLVAWENLYLEEESDLV